MKLEKILDNLNSFEKNPFLKIIDNIRSEHPQKAQEIDKILTDPSKDLKNADHINILKVFKLVEPEFTEYVRSEFLKTASQLDIITDILVRDGNCIMRQDWFERLYEAELKKLKKSVKNFNKALDKDGKEIDDERKRDYLIYKRCLETAYTNDDSNNQERKITKDESSILHTLSSQMGLSQEEIKLINYGIVPVEKLQQEELINIPKTIGLLFHSKKNNTIYVADEIVRILRTIRDKEVADKFFRRVLRQLREPQINLICKKHNINWRNSFEEKIRSIIDEGISFSDILIEDIYKPGTTLTDRKKFVNELCNKKLNISQGIKGVTIEEKVDNLIKYFEEVERDDKVGISIEGYDKLLTEMSREFPDLESQVKDEFQLQGDNLLKSSLLLDYNIKPRDILEILPKDKLKNFCKQNEIKSRGDLIVNILDAYKDAENLYLENYKNIGFRDYSTLKENGIYLKEAELGVKFEELTKKIFEILGFDVDEELRKKVNTSRNKMDVVLNMGNSDVILIECKTIKESGYNKFSSVSRQLKSYADSLQKKDYRVIKSLLIAPDFSDEFVKECGLQYELNLSLITAETLINILNGFKESKLKKFPHNLLMRDVLIQEDRVIKAISK